MSTVWVVAISSGKAFTPAVFSTKEHAQAYLRRVLENRMILYGVYLDAKNWTEAHHLKEGVDAEKVYARYGAKDHDVSEHGWTYQMECIELDHEPGLESEDEEESEDPITYKRKTEEHEDATPAKSTKLDA